MLFEMRLEDGQHFCVRVTPEERIACECIYPQPEETGLLPSPLFSVS